MHGMLSAAIMLAAFAVIAAAGGVSAVGLYRAASGTPRRSRSPLLARLAGRGAQPEAPGSAPGPAAEPGDREQPREPALSEPGPLHIDEPVPADQSGGGRLYVLSENRRPRR